MPVLQSIIVWVLDNFVLILLFLLCAPFVVVIVEVVICIYQSLCFQVEELTGFRERFGAMYHLTDNRNDIRHNGMIFSHKNYWLFAANVNIGRVKFNYKRTYRVYPIEAHRIGLIIEAVWKNVKNCVINALQFLAMFVLCFPYILFWVLCLPERIYRWILIPLAFVIFYLAAQIKIRGVYQLDIRIINVDSSIPTECDVEVVYHRSIIKFHLHNPEIYPDMIQKDNINTFTSSLRLFFPTQRKIKLKAQVLLPEGIKQQDVPLSTRYLHTTYSNIEFVEF